MLRIKIKIFIVILVNCVFIANSVQASGLSTPGQGARPSGMGGAYTAVSDTPEAIYYNPAGITQIPRTSIELGASVIFPYGAYTPTSGEKQTSHGIETIPNFFLVQPLGKRVSLGLGAYVPYGRHNIDDPTRSFPRFEFLNVRQDISPVIAVKINKYISIGGGTVFSFNRGRLQAPNAFGGNDYLTEHGYGFGGIAGIMITPHPKVKIGASWRSGMNSDTDGTIRTKIPGTPLIKDDYETVTKYPDVFSLGLSYQASKKLLLAYDFIYNDWSHLDSIQRDFNKFGTVITPVNARDTIDHRLGLEYKVTDKTALRLGYSLQPRTLPTSSFLPVAFDGYFNEVSIGIGHKIKDLSIDLAYQFTFVPNVVASANQFGLNGNYDGFIHNIIFGLSYEF